MRKLKRKEEIKKKRKSRKYNIASYNRKNNRCIIIMQTLTQRRKGTAAAQAVAETSINYQLLA